MIDAMPRNQAFHSHPMFSCSSTPLLASGRECRPDSVDVGCEYATPHSVSSAAVIPQGRTPGQNERERDVSKGIEQDRSTDVSEGWNTKLPPLSTSSDSGRDGRITKPPPIATKQLDASFDSCKDGASTPTTAAAAAVAAAEHEKTKRDLARVSYELDVLKVDKSKLEHQVFTLRDQLADKDSRIVVLQQDLASQVETKTAGTQNKEEHQLRNENQSLEHRLEEMRSQSLKCEEENRSLRCQTAMSDDRIAKLEDELQAETEKARKTEGARNNWYKLYFQQNRENHSLQRVVEEQRNTIWDLEVALKQERAASRVASPGDYFKMMKANEPMNIQQQNVELKKELATMKQTLDNALYQMTPSEPETMSSLKVPGTTRSTLGKDDLPARW